MKTNKTTLKTLLFLCLIASIGACKKEVFDTVPPAASTPPPTTGGPSGPSQCDTLNYTEHTKIIFDTKCANAGCHDGASGAPYDLRDLTVIQGAKSSITNVVFVTETMPKSGSPALTETEKTTLKAWLDCGAKGDRVAPPTSTWKDVKSIFEAKCATCHPGTGPGDFKKYDDVKLIAANGKLNDRVFVKEDMPQASAPQLTKEEKDKIKKWIDEGAKNE
ncbi:MAG: c-type cytochrome [Flavobacteriales bacterium]|nr:c-type cytochrome [Flavobacteriales bacterium]